MSSEFMKDVHGDLQIRNTYDGWPRTVTEADINCLYCIKRLVYNVNSSCVKKPHRRKCQTCKEMNHPCEKIPRYFWETAIDLQKAARYLAAQSPRKKRATRLLHSRIRAFTKRVERRGRAHNNLPKAIDMPTFLASCLAQVTRLADYVGHMAGVPRDFEIKDADQVETEFESGSESDFESGSEDATG